MPRQPEKRPDDLGPPDDDGLIHDEYTDESLEDVDDLDALDVPGALLDARVLEEVADGGDGIEEIDLQPGGDEMDTIDTGARHHAVDEAEMGLGAEPRSIEELADASIGNALRGPGSVTRDDERHGAMFLDAPDDADELR